MVKILIINPNSSADMTKVIEKNARDFAQDDFLVDCVPNPTAPDFIVTYDDISKTAPGMREILLEKQEDYDAFVIACHGDPNLDMLKEISQKPVVGIAEASMKIASMLGHKFSILLTGDRGVPAKENLVHRYGMERFLESIIIADCKGEGWKNQEGMIQAAEKALEETMAEVIVLGCAGMGHVTEAMQERLGVPVLDGVTCALIVAYGLAKKKIPLSKKRQYRNDNR
ncbi:aspartate/glutamate racemase family protein [Hominifimenecus sp. rT4P-3]|uniref:aspartate/glutamate racemase family protein n=1 Tax=Hominifimenecus sp. rT4P-3 TaxID=3242979 RepID=UPI003DA5B631